MRLRSTELGQSTYDEVGYIAVPGPRRPGERHAAGTFGRPRAAMRNPRDGAMWLVTSNGTGDRVLRITRFP